MSVLETNAQDRFSDLVLGTDLVAVARLEQNYKRFGRAFFEKILTDEELRYCQPDASNPRIFIKRAAGRIAVKEAVSKAMGVGINGLGWTEGLPWKSIEVVSQKQQPPSLRLSGKAAETAQKQLIRRWRISLSHDGDYAIATVVGLIIRPS